MEGSQIYIGTPNGIVVCINGGTGDLLQGCFYHSYSRDPVEFNSVDGLIFEMEKFFDSINFPHPATNIRSFADNTRNYHQREKREKVMKDQELLGRHGDMGSFIIRVQQRQNSSMQGRLTWIEKNKTVYFRSVWEMIRLIDSAVEMNAPLEDEDQPSWED